jgi:hypothetical protein
MAHLHVLAFASNALIEAIYPTEEIWSGLAGAVLQSRGDEDIGRHAG